MRKLYLVALVGVVVLLFAHKPASAQVTDYFTFTNSTTITWLESSYSLGSGETMVVLGQTSVSGGHASNGYYSAPANSGSTFQEVWTSSDNETCTFKSSATYSQTYGTWEFRVSASKSGPTQTHACNAGQAEANNTTSPAYTYYFSVSN